MPGVDKAGRDERYMLSCDPGHSETCRAVQHIKKARRGQAIPGLGNHNCCSERASAALILCHGLLQPAGQPVDAMRAR